MARGGDGRGRGERRSEDDDELEALDVDAECRRLLLAELQHAEHAPAERDGDGAGDDRRGDKQRLPPGGDVESPRSHE